MGDKRVQLENVGEQWAITVELCSFKSVILKQSLHLTLGI